MNRIEELSQRIKEAKNSYYNLLDNMISDSEYDALIDELKSLDPNNIEIASFDAEPPKDGSWQKIKHEIPMGSLDKVNSENEFRKWADGIDVEKGPTSRTCAHFVITQKIDGSSMELIYKKGKLINCITRGKDGITGEEVSENVKQVPSIPHSLPNEINAIIRGEIVMLKTVFKTLYADEYANPRNTAAAKVREKKNNGKDCVNLDFIAYRIQIQDQPKTMYDIFKWLSQHKFKIPSFIIDGDLEAMCELHNQINQERDDIPYEIDGTVISVNDLNLLDELGDLHMRPRGQIAWKFSNTTAETNIIDIKWQVGPSGRITPVAVVEPIKIEGVTIINISLHNLSMFKDLNLFKGCRILISRRNMVIPYVERNLDNNIDNNSN